MRYTSAEAAKLLRRLNEERNVVALREDNSKEFLAAVGEDVESVRPEYDYAAAQQVLLELDRKIRTVKHAINVFNVTHEVPGTGMTIDQVLIYIPQLTARKRKLYEMQNLLPKQRESAVMMGRGNSVIDYRYANYDIAAVKEDYGKVSDELAKVQTALDAVNSQETMEILL